MQNPTTATTSNAQECIDILAASEPAAVAIAFDSSNGECAYSKSIYGYDWVMRSAGFEPAFYLRTGNVTKDLSESECLTKKDGEYLLAKVSFGDDQCPQPWSTYDSGSGLCTTTNPDYYLGAYADGRLANGTRYMLSRDVAIAAASYECPNDTLEAKWMFNGNWYCYKFYSMNVTSATMKSNKCAEIWTGSGPVKAFALREYGLLGDMSCRYGKPVCLGMIRWNGKFTWSDGTQMPGPLRTWAAGRPLNDSAYYMAYVTSSDLTLADGKGSDMLCCRNQATNVGYDPAKFL